MSYLDLMQFLLGAAVAFGSVVETQLYASTCGFGGTRVTEVGMSGMRVQQFVDQTVDQDHDRPPAPSSSRALRCAR